MKSRSQNIRNLLVVMLLAIFTAHYVGSTMFNHSHTINGATIVHSHIHNSNHSDDGNQHSQNDIKVISQLTLSTLIAPEAICLDSIQIKLLHREYNISVEKSVLTRLPITIPARAPPVNIFA